MAEPGAQTWLSQQKRLILRALSQRKWMILRALSMVVGCLGMAFSGSVFVYNAYANALKAMFNLTQEQGEILQPKHLLFFNKLNRIIIDNNWKIYIFLSQRKKHHLKNIVQMLGYIS